MDSFDIDNVKAEKANAMKRYRRLQKIAYIFRLLEVALVFISILWFSTRVPIVFQASGKYFKDLGVFLFSPRSVFLIGNAIILTLFVKSGQLSGQNPTANNSGSYLYDEIVKNRENRQSIRKEIPPPMPEEIVYQDKHTVSEEVSVTYPYRDAYRREETNSETKTYRRSKSENLKRDLHMKPHRALRRSETEKCRSVDTSGKEPARISYAEEDMSSEEFQRTVDAFIIARKAEFHREESMAIVVHN